MARGAGPGAAGSMHAALRNTRSTERTCQGDGRNRLQAGAARRGAAGSRGAGRGGPPTFASVLMSSTTRRMEVVVTLCTVLLVVSAARPTHSTGSLTGFTCGARCRTGLAKRWEGGGWGVQGSAGGAVAGPAGQSSNAAGESSHPPALGHGYIGALVTTLCSRLAQPDHLLGRLPHPCPHMQPAQQSGFIWRALPPPPPPRRTHIHTHTSPPPRIHTPTRTHHDPCQVVELLPQYLKLLAGALHVLEGQRHVLLHHARRLLHLLPGSKQTRAGVRGNRRGQGSTPSPAGGREEAARELNHQQDCLGLPGTRAQGQRGGGGGSWAGESVRPGKAVPICPLPGCTREGCRPCRCAGPW